MPSKPPRSRTRKAQVGSIRRALQLPTRGQKAGRAPRLECYGPEAILSERPPFPISATLPRRLSLHETARRHTDVADGVLGPSAEEPDKQGRSDRRTDPPATRFPCKKAAPETPR